MLEDIPREYIRPIRTGRLRLYKDLKSSLKLLKRRLEAQRVIDKNERALEAEERSRIAAKHSHHKHHHHVHHPHHMPDFDWSCIKPSEIAKEIAKESDWLIARALHGLPPPNLDYMHATLQKGHFQNGAKDTHQKELTNQKKEEEEVDSDSESDTDVSSSDLDDESDDKETSYVGDMPKVGSVVAAQLRTRAGIPWKRAYCGVVTGVNPPKIVAKAEPLHQTMTKQARERQVETTTRMLVEGTSTKSNIDSRQTVPDTKLVGVQVGEWSVDVCFDDYELAIEQNWPKGKLNRVIERLFRKDLCQLIGRTVLE